MIWQIRWDKSCVWKVSIGWWDQGCSCIWPSQKSKYFLLWQLITYKILRLVAGTPEWVKDWITRILNANQYLLDLLTSAVSAFCLEWSIASDTFSSLFQTHILFHIYLKFLISIKPAKIKHDEQVKSQIKQHQDHHLQFGIFNNYNISFEHVHFEYSCKSNLDKFNNNDIPLI